MSCRSDFRRLYRFLEAFPVSVVMAVAFLGIQPVHSSGILVVESETPGAVVRINTETGEQAVVSSGGDFVLPHGIAVSDSGEIFVSDRRAFDGAAAVFEIDVDSGEQRVVAVGGLLVDPRGLTTSGGDTLFVADTTSQETGAVIRIDVETGGQQIVATGGDLKRPADLVLSRDGSLFVANLDIPMWPFAGWGWIVRVDPVTGTQEKVAGFKTPCGLALEEDGTLLVSDPNAFGTPLGGPGGILRLDPATGETSIVLRDATSNVGYLECGIVSAANWKGTFATATGRLFRVDPATDEPIVVSEGSWLVRPRMIAFEHAAPDAPAETIPVASPVAVVVLVIAIAVSGWFIVAKSPGV